MIKTHACIFIRNLHAWRTKWRYEMDEKNFDKEVELCRTIEAYHEELIRLTKQKEETETRIRETDESMRFMINSLKDMLLVRAAADNVQMTGEV